MKKRIITAFLSLVMILGTMPTIALAKSTTDVWDGSVATEFAGGAGTESDPYKIATGSQLAYLSKSINSYTDGDTDYRTSYFVLTNDIDLSSSPWTPIGHTYDNLAKGQYFSGNFDGKNHTVSGMKIALTSPDAYTFTGLFGVSEASISNLNVSGNIEISKFAQANYVAGICGYYAGNIDNCTSNVNITFDNSANGCFVGGVVGYLDVGCKISNCINKGNISLANTNNFSRIGGVVGCIDNKSTISGCKNEGNITAKMGLIGGITGEMVTSGDIGVVTIENSYSTGDVTMTGAESNSCTGGIVGGLHALCDSDPSGAIGLIKCCFSTGAVSMTFVNGSGACGPVYGDITQSTNGKNVILNCYYVNEAVDHPTNQEGVQITADQLNKADFLNKISGGNKGVWTQCNTGTVVLEIEIADYSKVDTAIAKIPANLSVYTDASVKNLNTAKNSVIYNCLKTQQSTVDEYAVAINNAVASLVKKQTAVVQKSQKITTSFSSKTLGVSYIGKQYKLNAKANTKLTYKSSNTKVATVNSKGVVTIKGKGTATITVNAAATKYYKKATKSVKIVVQQRLIKYTTKYDTNYRAGAGTNYRVIDSIKKGKAVYVLEKTEKKGTNKKIWVKIKIGGKYYWMQKNLLKLA